MDKRGGGGGGIKFFFEKVLSHSAEEFRKGTL